MMMKNYDKYASYTEYLCICGVHLYLNYYVRLDILI